MENNNRPPKHIRKTFKEGRKVLIPTGALEIVRVAMKHYMTELENGTVTPPLNGCDPDSAREHAMFDLRGLIGLMSYPVKASIPLDNFNFALTYGPDIPEYVWPNKDTQ